MTKCPWYYLGPLTDRNYNCVLGSQFHRYHDTGMFKFHEHDAGARKITKTGKRK